VSCIWWGCFKKHMILNLWKQERENKNNVKIRSLTVNSPGFLSWGSVYVHMCMQISASSILSVSKIMTADSSVTYRPFYVFYRVIELISCMLASFKFKRSSFTNYIEIVKISVVSHKEDVLVFMKSKTIYSSIISEDWYFSSSFFCKFMAFNQLSIFACLPCISIYFYGGSWQKLYIVIPNIVSCYGKSHCMETSVLCSHNLQVSINLTCKSDVA